MYIYVIYVIYHVDTTRINSSMQLHHSQVQTHSGTVPWGVPEKLAEHQFFCRCTAPPTFQFNVHCLSQLIINLQLVWGFATRFVGIHTYIIYIYIYIPFILG